MVSAKPHAQPNPRCRSSGPQPQKPRCDATRTRRHAAWPGHSHSQATHPPIRMGSASVSTPLSLWPGALAARHLSPRLALAPRTPSSLAQAVQARAERHPARARCRPRPAQTSRDCITARRRHGWKSRPRTLHAGCRWLAGGPACLCLRNSVTRVVAASAGLGVEQPSTERNGRWSGEGSAWRVGDRGRQRASEGGSGDNGMHGWPGLLGPPSIACGRCSLSAFEDIDWGQHRRIPSFLTFDPFHPIHSTPFPQLIPSETYPEPKDHIPLIPASYTPHTDPNFTRSHTAPPRRRP